MKTTRKLVVRVDGIEQHYHIGTHDKFRRVEDKGTLRYIEDNATYLYNHKPESQRRVSMTPSEFLRLAAKTTLHPETVAELVDKMKEGVALDPLFLDIDVKRMKVKSHEGRHRAEAAKQLGIDKVPVLLYFFDSVSEKKMGVDRFYDKVTWFSTSKIPSGKWTIQPEDYGFPVDVTLPWGIRAKLTAMRFEDYLVFSILNQTILQAQNVYLV